MPVRPGSHSVLMPRFFRSFTIGIRRCRSDPPPRWTFFRRFESSLRLNRKRLFPSGDFLHFGWCVKYIPVFLLQPPSCYQFFVLPLNSPLALQSYQAAIRPKLEASALLSGLYGLDVVRPSPNLPQQFSLRHERGPVGFLCNLLQHPLYSFF